MKPGYKTSEFWLVLAQVSSTIASIVYALQTIAVINNNPEYTTVLVVVGTVANALSINAYNNSRSEQKIAALSPTAELAG